MNDRVRLALTEARDAYIRKAAYVHRIFYSSLASATLANGIAQALLYDNQNRADHQHSVILDQIAFVIGSLSTIVLSLLAVCNVSYIAKNLEHIAMLLNIYLSDLTINEEEKQELRTKIISFIEASKTMWVE